MPENDHNQHNPGGRQKKSLLPAFIAIAIIVLLAVGAALYLLPEPGLDQEPGQATVEPLDTTPAPKVIETVTEPTREESPPILVEEPTAPVEEEPPPPVPTEEEILAAKCTDVARQLHGFFLHLDERDYIAQYQLNESSQQYFTALAYRLLDNPPVVSRESDDLYTILRNMAHFFRIIGKDNILLIKSILDRERDKIEDVAAELYFWSSNKACTSDLFSFAPALEKVYEYAGFFLNTMGGRSYLFRRDSRSRLLVNYYSILLIDMANARSGNRHGINISLLIPQLVQEIESSNQLIYKEDYLDRLYELLERYQ